MPGLIVWAWRSQFAQNNFSHFIRIKKLAQDAFYFFFYWNEDTNTLRTIGLYCKLFVSMSSHFSYLAVFIPLFFVCLKNYCYWYLKLHNQFLLVFPVHWQRYIAKSVQIKLFIHFSAFLFKDIDIQECISCIALIARK